MLKNCALRKIHMLTYGHLAGLQRENGILFEKIQNGSVHDQHVLIDHGIGDTEKNRFSEFDIGQSVAQQMGNLFGSVLYRRRSADDGADDGFLCASFAAIYHTRRRMERFGAFG